MIAAVESGAELPEPMTPAESDLRGMPFMPIDVMRLLESDLFALSTGEEFKAALALWCKSWLQVPAGSLPNDERILAHLSGNRQAWPELREIAMRGWTLCADGRLYHAVVAEKVNPAWERRGEWRERNGSKAERQARWRERLKVLSARLREKGVAVPERPKMETLIELCGRHSVDTNVDVQGVSGRRKETKNDSLERGQGTGDSREGRVESGQGCKEKVRGDITPPRAASPEDHLWSAGKAFLVSRGVAEGRVGGIIGKWKRDYGVAATIEAIGVAQVEPNLVDPLPFITKVLKRRSTDDEDDPRVMGGMRFSAPC